ncbi:MAG: DNA methyltransferase [Phycisphaera sp.]|nr:MAG: DNA methyltransferase [Phycisphaera sp.]
MRSNPYTQQRATQLRAETTLPERLLWSKLRSKQLLGFRFRRQHPLGPYIADFYCHETALVIEVDGQRHVGERKLRDMDRDAWMHERGIDVLRFTSYQVRDELDVVCATILRRCRVRCGEAPHPSPPPHAGEGARGRDSECSRKNSKT